MSDKTFDGDHSRKRREGVLLRDVSHCFVFRNTVHKMEHRYSGLLCVSEAYVVFTEWGVRSVIIEKCYRVITYIPKPARFGGRQFNVEAEQQ